MIKQNKKTFILLTVSALTVVALAVIFKTGIIDWLLPRTGTTEKMEFVSPKNSDSGWVLNSNKHQVFMKFPSSTTASVGDIDLTVSYVDKGKGVFTLSYTKVENANIFDTITTGKPGNITTLRESIQLKCDLTDSPKNKNLSQTSDADVVKLQDTGATRTHTFKLKNVDIKGALTNGGVIINRWVPGYSLTEDVLVQNAMFELNEIPTAKSIDLSDFSVDVVDENVNASAISFSSEPNKETGDFFSFQPKHKGNYTISVKSKGNIVKTLSTTVLEEEPTNVRNSFFGVCNFDIEALKNLKVGMFGNLRFEIPWSEVEQQKGVYKMPSNAVEELKICKENNIRPLVLLNGGSSFYPMTDGKPVSEESQNAWKDYASWVVKYCVQNGFNADFEIYNEWMFPNDLLGNDYIRLLKNVYQTLKSLSPQSSIVGGATIGLTPEWGAKWSENVLNNASNFMDVFSVHLYPSKDGVEQTMDRINSLVQRSGLKKPIWITEFGYSTYSNGLSEEEAALETVKFVGMVRGISNVEKLFYYNFRNNNTDKHEIEHNFGLVRTKNETLGYLTPKMNYQTIFEMAYKLDGLNYERCIKKDGSDELQFIFTSKALQKQAVMKWSPKLNVMTEEFIQTGPIKIFNNTGKLKNIAIESPTVTDVDENKEFPIQVKAYFESGEIEDITDKVELKSNSSSVLKITENARAVVGNLGKATISASVTEEPSITATIDVDTRNLRLNELCLFEIPKFANESSIGQMKVIGRTFNGILVDATNSMQYSSSNPSVYAVSPNGQIRNLRPGKAIISATYKYDSSKSKAVTIDSSYLSGIGDVSHLSIIPPTYAQLDSEKEAPIEILAVFNNGNTENVTERVLLQSSDKAIVDVVSAGKIKISTLGIAKLTATMEDDEEISTSIDVNTKDLRLSSINSLEVPKTFNEKNEAQVKLVATTFNGKLVDATKTSCYTSSNEEILTVDANGQITKVSNGKATLTAIYKYDSTKKISKEIDTEKMK